MSWKHVILIPCILSVALMAALAVTPEEVKQKATAMAEEIGLARWQYTFTKSQTWLTLLQEAETTKANLTTQLINYSMNNLENIFVDYFINATSVDEDVYSCVQSVMDDFSEYSEAILSNIDNLLLEIRVSINNIATVYDQAASDVKILSESINSCEDSACAEELDDALTTLDSNVTYTLTTEEIKVQELSYEITNTNISNAYTADLVQLKERAIECVNL